jgi:large repetitive protein
VLHVSAQPPLYGEAVVALGGIRYEHDGSEGPTDEVVYTVCDDDGGCVDSLLAVTVTPVNDPPVAFADATSVDEGATAVVDVLTNDLDPDDTLVYTDVTLVSGPFHGTAQATAAGLSYTHDGSETLSDELVYRVCDGAGLCSEASLALTVAPVNDAPVATADTLTVAEGAEASVDVLANDLDPDSVLTAASVDSVPTHGTLTVSGAVFTYTHDGSEAPDDAFTYTVCDAEGACSTGSVAVVVTPVDDPPVAANDTLTVVEGGTASLDVRLNDTDADSPAPSVSAGAASHGQVSVDDGVLTYVHDGSETTTDSVPYTLCDGTSCDEATVAVTITPVNDAPIAVDDLFAVDGTLDVPASEGVLANDSDPEEGALSATVVRGPSHGLLTLSADGSFVYEPEEGYTGADAFTYAASDGEDVGEAEVTLAVGAVAGKGCGCASGGGVAGWGLVLMVAGGVRRRR